MNRIVAAVALSVFVLVGLAPRRAEAGMLEGALIGAAVGAIVGVIAQASKPKTPEAEVKVPAAAVDSASAADSVPVFR
ncbi:MAG TPA: hypothetical protein PK208_10230 [Fibrobacteria bacterium]|nr:hypothetical protein [Fibrobacteria bacterium]